MSTNKRITLWSITTVRLFLIITLYQILEKEKDVVELTKKRYSGQNAVNMTACGVYPGFS